MKKTLLFLFTVLNLTLCDAQNYQAIDTADYAERKAFTKEFKTKNENHIKSLKEKYPGKTGKELAKIYTEFETFFSKEVANKNYAFKSDFEKYIQDIITELRKTNPQIPNDLKVLIAKSNQPNAYCLADGTFVINMGLFNWLDNREQIASVITHELGHKILDHSLKTQLNNILTDVKNKTEVKQLKDVKFNKAVKAYDLLKKQTYSKGIISRKHEIESDSLGYLLYSNSSFKKTEFINAFKNLEQYDTISPNEVVTDTYKKIFTIPGQAFKEKWLNMEDFSGYNYSNYTEKINKDSISTHPEINERIAFLKKQFNELRTNEKANEADEEFLKMQEISRMEILPNLFYEEEYGVGVYNCLQFLQEGEKVDYYKAWLGKCFLKIYEARKSYQLNHYLDRIEPKRQSKSYQQFLAFMWNLSLEDIKNITEHYNKSS